MTEVVFVVLLVAFPLLGAFTRRWISVLFPLIAWPAFYVGLNRGWWGAGTGDGWEIVAGVVTVVGLVTTALAVLVARSLWPRRSSSAKSDVLGQVRRAVC